MCDEIFKNSDSYISLLSVRNSQHPQSILALYIEPSAEHWHIGIVKHRDLIFTPRRVESGSLRDKKIELVSELFTFLIDHF